MLAPADEPTADIWARFVATANAITGGQGFVVTAGADGTSSLAADDRPERERRTAGCLPDGAFGALQEAVGRTGAIVPDGPIRADLVAQAGRRRPVRCVPSRRTPSSWSPPVTRGCSARTTWACSTSSAHRPRCSSSGATLLEDQEALSERLVGARRRARGGERGQERLPGQHEPRAADAAQRDHRLQRPDAQHARRRRQRPGAGRVGRTRPSLRPAPARPDQRRPRPGQDRGGPDGARSRAGRPRPGRGRVGGRPAARRGPQGRAPRGQRRFDADLGRSRPAPPDPLQPPLERDQVHARAGAS